MKKKDVEQKDAGGKMTQEVQMRFEIYVGKKLIAQFVDEQSRDDCLYFLARKYDECKFRKVNK